MGFQLGPKFLRRPPKDWLPARAYAVKHTAYAHHNNDPEGGESVIETSAGLSVTWRVELDGRAPYEFAEKRAGPTWLLQGPPAAASAGTPCGFVRSTGSWATSRCRAAHRRIRELGRIKETGRRATAIVVAREETTRTLSSVPIVDLTFEIDDEGEPRRVAFEHAFGPRHAKRYRVGTRVDVWIDPEDPGAICPGE